MKKTLKTLAMALLLTAATVTAVRAETLYQSVNTSLVLTYYQTPGTTNDQGTITYLPGYSKLTTAQFLQLLAGNLGITDLSKNASLMRVTSLTEGTNFTDFITNMTGSIVPVGTVLPDGNTVLTNIQVPMTLVWANTSGNTNLPPYYTNTFTTTPPVSTQPNTNYTVLYSVGTNLQNFVIQGKAERVILGNNVQYFIINGSDITDTNLWLPLSYTNNNAYVRVQADDEAWNFLNNNMNGGPYYIDDQNSFSDPATGLTNYFGDQYYASGNVVFNEASIVTNLKYNIEGSGFGPIFVGSIKTNMTITGTLYDDEIKITDGPPAQPLGTQNFISDLSLKGWGNATSVTKTVGSRKDMLPFTSWNTTFDVKGSGELGGVDTNTINTNFFYLYLDASAGNASNTAPGQLSESPGFYEPGVGDTTNTNPPVSFTNSFTYVSGSNQYVYPYEGIFPAPVFTNTPDTKIVTPDLTGYYYTYVTNIYTNIATNVYTLVSPSGESTYTTNYSIFMPVTTHFRLTGTVKVTTLKISTP